MYCTVEHIISAMDERLVAQLSNDVNPSQINIDVLENIINTNNEIIDGYLRGRYPLPFNKSIPILTEIAIQLVKYDLYRRRDKVTQLLQDSRKEVINTLINIQKGIITLDVGTSETRPTAYAVTAKSGIFDNALNKFNSMLC